MADNSNISKSQGPRVFVEKISSLCVSHFGKDLYNTNNYGATRPSDYAARQAMCNTSRWADKVGRSAERFTIPSQHVKWMRSSYEMARRLRAFPYHMYQEDMDELIEELGPSFNAILNQKEKEWIDKGNVDVQFPGFFIRGEAVSLKDGVHGVGPYRSLKAIIESICTASYQHSVLAPPPSSPTATTNEGGEEEGETSKLAPASPVQQHLPLPLFLFPWVDDLVEALELRVFVCNRIVTAMSQQHLYTTEPIWQHAPLSQIQALAKRVVTHFDEVVSKVVDDQDNFTYDLGFRCPPPSTTDTTSTPPTATTGGDAPPLFEDIALKRGVPYFIEPNPFGAEYPAGSSLFDWRYDNERLCNGRGDVFVRFTIGDETEVY